MLITPKELQAAAQRAAEQKAAKEARSAEEREKLESLRRQFEAECLAAALRRKTRISFDPAILKVVDLRGFVIDEVRRDQAREQFLGSKLAETDALVASLLDSLVAEHPALTTHIFPNRLAKDFRGLLDRCINQESEHEVVSAIKRQLCLVTSFSSDSWEAFEGKCIRLARERMALEAVQIKHSKIAENNAAIPQGLNAALKISWDGAEADFGKAGEFSASKLKWIATVWPRWEKHFNADIEEAASVGMTSREWLFWSAGYWGEDDSFVVDVKGVQEPDVDSMTEEERRIYFYWKEIDERDDKVQRYDEEEGVLIGVHPLPVAEIFAYQGFQVKLEEREDEDDDGNIATRAIGIADLDECLVELNYKLLVSWGKE